jgi:diguanylate cyclase (GGDEF)-like protein
MARSPVRVLAAVPAGADGRAMLLPAADATQPRRRAGGRRYDPVEAKAVVRTLFMASTAIGAALQVLPMWQDTSRIAIGVITLGTATAALVVPRLRELPYPAATTITACGCAAIAIGQYFAGPGAPASALGAVYSLALAAAFLLYSTRVLVLQVLLASAWQVIALAALGEGRTAATTVAVTMGSAAGTGIVARKLADLRAEAEAELAWRASHDGLTGLANRTALIREWHALPAPPGGAVSVLVLDLRGFKQVNDALGHLSGDTVLVQVAERLAALDPPAFPCRLGGDEFAVLLPGAGRQEAFEHAQRVSGRLHDRYEVDGVTVPLGATVGVATHVWPVVPPVRTGPDAGSADGHAERARALSALLAAADEAMYHARVQRCRVASADQVATPRGRAGSHL